MPDSIAGVTSATVTHVTASFLLFSVLLDK
jgi:hypothetical protein